MIYARKRLRHALARTVRRYSVLTGIKRQFDARRGSIPFSGSQAYWESRYTSGGDSGEGSYGKLARYKANFINEFSRQHACRSVVELGCGDGNQASLFQLDQYTGIDISEKCIDICRRKLGRSGWTFKTLAEHKQSEAPAEHELGLSLDVVYHLVEDHVYRDYLDTLFKSSRVYCLIYASNFEYYDANLPHVRHRTFVSDISEWHPDWTFIEAFENPYLKPHDSQEYGSFAKFHLFRRNY